MVEDIDRLMHETEEAERDGIKPNERVRRRIQGAIGYGSLFINPNDTFVVMGIDGMDGSMFPCGSSTDIEEARKLARQKIDEEPQYSSSSDGSLGIGSSFYVFTMDGVRVPLEEMPE